MSTTHTNPGQSKQILAHLKRGLTLTPLEALNKFGCLRLGARIHELKSHGHRIATANVKRNGKRVAEYSLEDNAAEVMAGRT